jgi:hypothetical protein
MRAAQGLFLFTGRVVIEDADGFATSVSHIPKLTDICHILAQLGADRTSTVLMA